MTKQKLSFNLEEEMELNFTISVQGTNNAENVKPIMRFLITRKENVGVFEGLIFNASPTDEGVCVVVPALKGILTHEEEYEGTLEIIVGNRYFTPVCADISFVEPLQIQAKVSPSPEQPAPTRPAIDDIPLEVFEALELKPEKENKKAENPNVDTPPIQPTKIQETFETIKKSEIPYKKSIKNLLRDSLK